MFILLKEGGVLTPKTVSLTTSYMPKSGTYYSYNVTDFNLFQMYSIVDIIIIKLWLKIVY